MSGVGFRLHQDRNSAHFQTQFSNRLFSCVSPHQIPVTMAIGGSEAFSPMLDGSGKKLQWMYTGETPTKSTVTAQTAIGASTGTDAYGNATYADITLPVANPEYFNEYSVIKICAAALPDPLCDSATSPTTSTPFLSNEMLVWVKERDLSAKTLTIRAGWNGSTPIDPIPQDSEMQLMWTSAPECPDPVSSYIPGLSTGENFVQMFYDGYEVSEQARLAMYNGQLSHDDIMEMFRTQLFGGTYNGVGHAGKLPKALEQAVVRGIGHVPDASGLGEMKGLLSFNLPSYCFDTFSYNDLRTVLKDLEFAGANVDGMVMIGGPGIQVIIDDWGANRVQNYTPESTTYGYSVSDITTSFGTVTYMRSNNAAAVRENEILLLDPSNIGLYEVPGFGWNEREVLGGTNYCQQYEIGGMFSLIVGCTDHHAVINLNDPCLDVTCTGSYTYSEPAIPTYDFSGVAV